MSPAEGGEQPCTPADIRVHTEDGVATLTFDRVDKKNSITTAMYAAMADALAAAVEGGFFVSRQVAAHVRNAFVAPAGEPGDGDGIGRLTQRQREVLQLIAEGHSTRDIARLLFISVKTVETHRAEIMRRLDIHDVAGLTRLAIRSGLVSPER